MPATHTEPKVDMTQPASSILRAGTIKMHDEISKSETATYLTKGELDREDYIWYLMMLWHIYKALEAGLAANAYDSVLSPTYNPALLARGSALSSDISFLLGVPDDDRSWKSHQANQALLLSPPPAFRAYISRLTRIIKEDPRRLLAHSYIRYMGDLSGGQIMKGNIRKAYGLTNDQGTRFYNFGVMGSEGQSDPALANMGEVKRIKEWFKNGIDAGVGNDIELKGALLDETTRAYLLHKDLFDEIKASGSKIQKSVVCASSPMPLDRERKSSKMFSVHSVLTFMLAVGFAHLIVVVGGLSGSRGYEKLEAVQGWVTSAVFST
ncbi:hypothetical protein BJ322DRAFT_1157114 [Thelephora terrestris]|uniref:Heme oxygenase n=1 Tax=Thelephora terrestris TaxID=56493 RepID=A0A9P6HC32_9AGAM|nr:hypothetical protein BJ322DRAFT_1157114 [Thelephora terrestris]